MKTYLVTIRARAEYMHEVEADDEASARTIVDAYDFGEAFPDGVDWQVVEVERKVNA